MKTNPYKVSICVPIYGVEQYIERCVTSLFEQTYENLEYIFVNDCTKDNSIAKLEYIIKKYPQRIHQIKIIHHEKNKGLGSARNTATDNASGDFIIHIDSDDYVDKKIVEELVKKQLSQDADIVSCGYNIITSNKQTTRFPPNISNIEDLTLKLLSRNTQMHIWGRLIRASLYHSNNISVPESINMGEDYVTITKLISKCKKIDFINTPLYYYECTNENSYTHSFSEVKSRQVLKCIDNLREYFQFYSIEYQKSIDIAELKLIAKYMIGCFKDQQNHTQFYYDLRKHKNHIDKKLWKNVKISHRIVLQLNSLFLIKLYIKMCNPIFNLIKHITK